MRSAPQHHEHHPLLEGWRLDLDAAAIVDDVYETPLADPTTTVDELFGAMFTTTPTWLVWLMRVRNAIVTRIGFEAGDGRPPDVPAHPKPGDKVGAFTVQERSEHEIVFGGTDRHMAMRISIARVEGEAGAAPACSLATIAAPVSKTGRAYLWLVDKFHGRVAERTAQRCAGFVGP